jgi:Flp pilus assembly protein TadG
MTPAVFRNFLRDRRANVAMIFGLSVIPLVFTIGMTIDYADAERIQSKLNAAADSAALAAVTPAMMKQTDAQAQTAAINMFKAQMSGMPTLVWNDSDLTVTIGHVNGANSPRTATVSYAAQSTNFFAGILGRPTINVAGTSAAKSAYNPNMNFYVLVDTSPSMAVAATTDGIKLLQDNTLGQWGAKKGCAFACHEINPRADNLGNPGGANQDDYALARQLNVKLRIDNVQAAVQNLATTADQMQSTNRATYNMAIYSFDANFNTITTMTTPSSAASAANNIQLLEIYQGGYLTKNSPFNPNENDTYSQVAFSKINQIMPNPGGGTTAANDTPKEFLFIITDGVENDPSIDGLMDISICQTIKNRNIQIGVVYTTYFPIPTYTPYINIVQPIQTQIGPNLLSCASSSDYFAEVNTDGNISDALNAIFMKVTNVSRLTQ